MSDRISSDEEIELVNMVIFVNRAIDKGDDYNTIIRNLYKANFKKEGESVVDFARRIELDYYSFVRSWIRQEIESARDGREGLREVIQEIALSGASRSETIHVGPNSKERRDRMSEEDKAISKKKVYRTLMPKNGYRD